MTLETIFKVQTRLNQYCTFQKALSQAKLAINDQEKRLLLMQFVFSYFSSYTEKIIRAFTFYFLGVNTRYISSDVLKISVISRVRSTSKIADIFNTFNEIYLVFAPKK